MKEAELFRGGIYHGGIIPDSVHEVAYLLQGIFTALVFHVQSFSGSIHIGRLHTRKPLRHVFNADDAGSTCGPFQSDDSLSFLVLCQVNHHKNLVRNECLVKTQ